MLSRLAIKAPSLQTLLQSGKFNAVNSIRTLQTLPEKPEALPVNTAPDPIPEYPERDHVNFPKRKPTMYPDPVRLGFIPENWFTFFHQKTGVTGPYVFLGTFGTFLLSKEYYVLEHEFYSGVSLFLLLAIMYNKMSPAVTKYFTEYMEQEHSKFRNIKTNETKNCKANIEAEEEAKVIASSFADLYQAKKENVSLQLEAAYRARLQNVYKQVKSRLDYQLELANVMRRVEQRHMVEWILSNVKKSITPKQEDEALKKCISDLKSMAAAK